MEFDEQIKILSTINDNVDKLSKQLQILSEQIINLSDQVKKLDDRINLQEKNITNRFDQERKHNEEIRKLKQHDKYGPGCSNYEDCYTYN
jgi:hypothetical protein